MLSRPPGVVAALLPWPRWGDHATLGCGRWLARPSSGAEDNRNAIRHDPLVIDNAPLFAKSIETAESFANKKKIGDPWRPRDETLAVDELVGSSVDQASPETTATPPRSRRWPLFAVPSMGFLAQAGWRLYLSWPLPGPVAHADEDGYLLAARVVGGGADAMLPGWSIMRPIGYPLLLSPIHWFVERPEDVYKGVHIVNAAIMALIFPLIYALARRLFGYSPMAGGRDRIRGGDTAERRILLRIRAY